MRLATLAMGIALLATPVVAGAHGHGLFGGFHHGASGGGHHGHPINAWMGSHRPRLR